MKNNKKRKGFEWLKTLPKKRQKQFKRGLLKTHGSEMFYFVLNKSIKLSTFISCCGYVKGDKEYNYFMNIYLGLDSSCL